ncbi:MAG TPA: prephenate dehydrogenase [Polyangiaceae bacterium]|nr:prephenate dehydrogenase [Polyangiaceae bacterium]
MKVTIVGLGLLGGSFALSLREVEPSVEVTAVDLPEVLDRPAARRAAHVLIPVTDEARLSEAARGADLTLLAAPVRRIVTLLPRVLESARLVTDCGSTKRAIADAAAGSPRRGRFVLGHPMAGAPEGGIEHAQAGLFRGRRWLICPEGSDADALAEVETLVRRLGAEPFRIEAAAHDRAVALTSHATQLVASALAAVALETEAQVTAGPAFDGATRVAGGPEEMWGDILSTNARDVADALAALGRELETARAGLAQPVPDTRAALALLARARRLRRK